MYRQIIKVFTASCVSLVFRLFLSPFLLAFIILLAITNRGKAFFFQQLIGKNEQLFCVVKFKTISDCRDKNGQLLHDFLRITKLGGFMRKYSLDELPQLFNFLNGDMSQVGPRTLLIQYTSFYRKVQQKLHDVRRGITGWAQLNGRNAISWKKRFELDLWYVERVLLLFDCRILLMTFMKVLKSSDIDLARSVTIEAFVEHN